MLADDERVLVTGGSGMVGMAIQSVLPEDKKSKWHFASSADADLRNIDQTRNLFGRVQPTYVIHLAARVGGLFCNMDNMAEMCHDNLAMNLNVIHASHTFGVRKLVSCLSTCIFPDKTTYPITEEAVHYGPPHASNFGYAYAKRMIDVLNHAYNRQYGCIFTSVIPTNIFGPYDNFDTRTAHVIPALIRKCVAAVKDNHADFVVAGTGKPLRQFIYAPDLARLIIWVLYSYDSIEPLILSVPEQDEISIAQVAQEIARACKFKGNIKYDTTQPDGQFRKTASNAKLQSLFTESLKFTAIEEALDETVAWFMNNTDSLRFKSSD